MQEFFLQNIEIFSQPVIYATFLFLLIVTQIFGVLFAAVIAVVVKFLDIRWFLLITISAGVLGEIVNFYVGKYFSVYFKKKYPKAIKKVRKYTNFNSFLLARFIGVPFLSHAVGAAQSIKMKPFFIGTFLFFLVNAGVVALLGNTLPTKAYIAVIVSLALLMAWKGRKSFE